MFFNSWNRDHYVSNAFCFALSGLNISSIIYAFGGGYDSQICNLGGSLDRSGEVYQSTCGQLAVDFAFCGCSRPFLIQFAQDETNAKEPAKTVRLRQTTFQREAG